MTVDRVQIEIRHFLTDEEPTVFCLSGPWGVGKTYAWKAMLNEIRATGALDDRIYSYVSLFGVDTLSSFRASILSNIEYLNKNPKTDWLGRKAKEALPVVKIAAEALGLSDLANASSSLLFAAVRNQIICIDDIERRGQELHVKDVFGLISFLRQERNCRVAILLNEEGTEERESYRRYYEKVVDRSVYYNPSPSQSCRIALTKSLDIDAEITRRCIQLGIVNVRIIRSISSFLSDIVPLVRKYHPAVTAQIVHTVVLFQWSLLRGEGAPPIEKVESVNEIDLNDSENNAIDEDAKRWDELLTSYEFGSLDYLDANLLASLRRGYFDFDEAAPLLARRSEEYVQIDKSEKLRAAWALYRGSFDDDDDMVLGTLVDAVRDGAAFLPPSAVESVLRLLRELGRGDEATALAEFYVAARQGEARDFDVARQRGLDPIQDPDLIAGMKGRFEALSPVPSLLSTLKQLAERNSWNDNDLSLLASASPDEYLSLFLSQRGSDLDDIVQASLQFRRITNATPQMTRISDNAVLALRQIAGTSELNAHRVARFGVGP